MPVSKKQQACVNRYNAKAYDRINLMVKKGKKDEIKEHAQAHGDTVNGFINKAIDEKLERDNEKENGEG